MPDPVTPDPQSTPTPSQAGRRSSSWSQIKLRANATAQVLALLVFLVVGGAVVGYFFAASRNSPVTKKPAITTLSQNDLKQLSQITGDLGASGQVLNIAADGIFRGKVSVIGDLSVGGHLNANGPVTISSLNITGENASTGLNVGSNLIVTGSTTLQKNLTVGQLASLTNLNVNGNTSMNSLNASSIAVHNISISGPLTIGHLVTQGSAPTIVGGALGAGGTVSASGNDTAGTININTGTGPGATLATITFRATFSATPHVLITPLTDAAAMAGAYVTRTSGGFQVHAHAAPSGSVLSFDYLIAQ
jgi:cytoskeletal protein CcmA (bactofilin family)